MIDVLNLGRSWPNPRFHATTTDCYSGERLVLSQSSNIPNDIEQELRYVEAAGTKTLLIAADPGKIDLLSPAEIEPALKAGRDRAVREADGVKAFWA